MTISIKQLTTGVAIASALAVSGAAIGANTQDAGTTGVAPKYPKLDKPAHDADKGANAMNEDKKAFKAKGAAPAYPKMKTGDTAQGMKKDAKEGGMKMKDGVDGVTGVAPKYPTKKQ